MKTLLLSTLILSSASFAQIGSLNTTFSSDGLTFQFGTKNISRGAEVLLQNDGKTIVVGDSYTAGESGDIHVYRYNTDGTLDTGFGTNGVTTIASSPGTFQTANCATLTSDNKILIAGRRNNVAQVIRLRTDGLVDGTFDNDGIRLTGFSMPHEFNDIVALPDGEMLCLGVLNNSTGSDFIVAKITSTGADDATFGSSVPGYVGVSFGNTSVGTALHVNADNSFYVAGYTVDVALSADIAIAQISANGQSLVSSFGINGKKTFSVNAVGDNMVFAMQVLPNGNILLGGVANSKSLLCSLDPLGALNTDFNTTGYSLGNTGSFIHDIKMIHANKIAAVGTKLSLYDVFLFDTLGVVDPNFVRETMPNGVDDTGEFLSVTTDGSQHLYAAGKTQISENITQITLAKYNLVASTTGISENSDQQLAIYPNPAVNSLTISVVQPTQITICKVNGIEILKTIIDQQQTIDISDFAAGVYFIHTAEGQTIKLIKE